MHDPSVDGFAPNPSPDEPAEEVEWQFDAVDLRPVERWLAGAGSDVTVSRPGRIHEQIDTYADTDDWRLHRGGYSLRVRQRSGAFEATLKSLAPATHFLRRRTELNAGVPTGDIGDVLSLDHPLARTAKAMAGRHELRPLVEVRTRRTTFDLAMGGIHVGELVLDATTIPLGEGQEPARLRRVEIEVAPGAVDAIQPFVESLRDACALMPAPLSKFEVGLLASGRSPSDDLDLGPIEIDADLTTGEVAFAVLRAQFHVFLQKEPGTRLRRDPEELHDMRVATRRIRAALSLFGAALPVRAARFRDEFTWIAEALGRVRDLDVQLSELERSETSLPDPDRRPLQVLRRRLEADRRQAEASMFSTLDSLRYDRMVASFTAFLRRGPLRRSAASRTPIVITAPDIVSRRYRKADRVASGLRPGSSPEDYHRARISTKRLRYALEFTAQIYGKPARTLIKRLAVVQDLLGEHQDTRVAIARLRSLVDQLEEPPAATLFAMGRLAERYAARAATLRASFPETFRSVGPEWRHLRRRMYARREALGWRPSRSAAGAPRARIMIGAPTQLP
jgi:CHAD domain-containing protein